MGYYLFGFDFWICFLDYCLDIKKKKILPKGGLDYLYIISQRFILHLIV